MVRKMAAVGVVLGILLLAPGVLQAQSSTAGAEIDLELYFADNGGSNQICVQPGQSFWVYGYISPGTGDTTCALGCGSAAGGTGNIATGAVDVAFDSSVLTYVGIESNAASAAQDGLAQTQNLASGRIGWALAGDFAVNGNTASALADSCAMAKLDTAGWAFRAQFTAAGGSPGLTVLSPQRSPAFPLSFADACGTPFVEGSGIDEVIAARLYVIDDCNNLIFTDGFDVSGTGAWSMTGGN